MSIDTFLLSADTTDLDYPEVRPTLDLNFARVKALDPRITFTRASGGSYVGADGLIKYSGVNEARFDHDPYTGESLGLLVEEARTNLIAYSEDISQYQAIDNASVSINQIVSPDGNTTADKLTSTITGGSNTCHLQKISAVAVNTATYTFSVFLKAGTSPQTLINLQLAGGTYQQSTATINWTSNTITSSSGGTSALTAYPNGWYRVSITLTNNGTNNAIFPRVYVRGQGTDNVNGEFVYIWGWQTETGSFPTSYIPTVASTRTRAADNASITGKNFSEWYNQSEWTLVTNTSVSSSNLIASPAAVQYSSIDDGTTNNLYTIRYVTDTSAPYIDGYANSSGSSTFDFAGSIGATFPNPVKAALAVKSNDAAFCYNGNTVETDNSVTLSTSVNRLSIGVSPKAGTISRLTYYPKRLSNAQLQALTR